MPDTAKLLPHRKSHGEPPLIVALRADDPSKSIHVAEAARGLSAGAICPICREPLVARRGPINIDHFSHRSNSVCAGAFETALHVFAKECLARHARLVLPPLLLQHRGFTETVIKAQPVAFDQVRLEEQPDRHESGRIKPDVLATKAGHQLLIEIFVTHAVDPAKRSKIEQRNIAAIEINLSRLGRLEDPQALERAILETAPRAWLHHPRLESARRALDAKADQIEAKKNETQISLGERILKEIAVKVPDPAKLMTECHRLGLEGFLSDQLPWQWLSPMSHRAIQAHILVWLYRDFAQHRERWHHLISLGDVLRHLHAQRCFPPWFDSRKHAKAFSTARAKLPALEDPANAVLRLAEFLQERGVLEHAYGADYRIGDQMEVIVSRAIREEEDRQERRDAIRHLLQQIFLRAASDYRNTFGSDTWLQHPHGHHPTVLKAIETGRGYESIREALQAIVSFVYGTAPEPLDLLDMPLALTFEAERKRRSDREAEKRLKAEEQERRRRTEAERRASQFAETVKAMFPEGTPPWISWPYTKAGVAWPMGDGRQPCHIKLRGLVAGDVMPDIARADELGLNRCLAALDDGDDRADAIRKLRLKLTEAANRSFSAERAMLFLNSAHSKLPTRAKPLDYCIDQTTLSECLALIPTK